MEDVEIHAMAIIYACVETPAVLALWVKDANGVPANAASMIRAQPQSHSVSINVAMNAMMI